MSNPTELFANVVDETIAARKQFTNDGPVDSKAKSRKNPRMAKSAKDHEDTVVETKASLAMEVMRRENAEARADLKSAVSSFQAENALFRETVRGFITSSQVESAQARELVRDSVAGMKVDLSNLRSDMAIHSKDVEGKISGLKIWVLTGAISALVSALTLVGGAFLKSSNSNSTAAAAASTQAASPPSQPAVQVSLSGNLNSGPARTEQARQPAQQSNPTPLAVPPAADKP
ncbi:hypothetical protein [Stenotrophomonas rhizophila]|uniref:hypothetical protein n=1 Tax=Stenotrophomonas rhizophila TaxID=216778 RepID=UPI0028B15D15|nr:hypothetical protein [Stenotrophomonas rhizophila]